MQSTFNDLKTVHVIMYAASIAVALWIAVGLVRPFMKRNAKETRQVVIATEGTGLCAALACMRAIVRRRITA